MKLYFIVFGIVLILFSCTTSPTTDTGSDPVDILMQNVKTAHGNLGDFQFVFRENKYSFKFNNNDYTYTKIIENDSVYQKDVLTNLGFYRTFYMDTVRLTEKEKEQYSEALNSVIYFVCLPLKLDDPAVNKKHKGITEINGESYAVLEVSFDEEGGGKDHSDVFYYWFNQKKYQLDFLAYNYAVNGGGVRFRSAFNSRMVNGMRFQDYVNYGAPVGTALKDLPNLFLAGELEELSEIITENVEKL